MELKVIDKKTYDKHFEKMAYNHMFNLSAWNETCKVRNQIPWYLGFYDDNNNIVAMCALLQIKMPKNLCYFYATRGFLIDYNDKELFKEFTKALKKFLKEQNAVNLRLDPAIKYQDIDENGLKVQNGENNYDIYKMFLKNGYKHKGFLKIVKKGQPRHTFRINTTLPMEEIDKKINKTFMKTVKRSYYYDLEINDDFDVKKCMTLMEDIASKNKFTSRNEKFYQEIYNNFTKEKDIHYISVTIYPDKILNKANKELKELNEKLKSAPVKHQADLKNQIARCEKDIETFTPYKDEKDGILSLILICPKTKKQMWTLYIGNNNLANYTFAVNRAYYEAIKYAHDNGYDFLDLFGTTGDPKTKYKNFASLYEFKRKMGGEYIEFIGEFSLVNKKFLYFMLPKAAFIKRTLKKLGKIKS